MPRGIYERTELHRSICSKAGKASANSPYRQSLDEAKWEIIVCDNCTQKFKALINYKRRFCSKSCKDRGLRKPDNQLAYGTIHSRIRERYGTPSVCEHCGDTTSTKFEWANISGLYNLVREDWARLCCKCHRRYDRGTKNKIEVLNV